MTQTVHACTQHLRNDDAAEQKHNSHTLIIKPLLYDNVFLYQSIVVTKAARKLYDIVIHETDTPDQA